MLTCGFNKPHEAAYHGGCDQPIVLPKKTKLARSNHDASHPSTRSRGDRTNSHLFGAPSGVHAHTPDQKSKNRKQNDDGDGPLLEICGGELGDGQPWLVEGFVGTARVEVDADRGRHVGSSLVGD